jgi:hypothetical protein
LDGLSISFTNGDNRALATHTRGAYDLSMSIAELRKLPPSEKLKIIETLWSDLVAEDESFVSPAWHEAELRMTEADLAAGRIDVLDWDDAKKELQKRFE